MPVRRIGAGALESKEYQAIPTLFVLLGGTGMKVGLRLRRRLFEAFGVGCLPFQKFLWVDSDQNDLKKQTVGDRPEIERRIRFLPTETMDITLDRARVSQLINNHKKYARLWEWLDPQLLKGLGRDAQAIHGTSRIRPLGRLAFHQGFPEFQTKFNAHANSLRKESVKVDAKNLGYDLEGKLEVVLVGSVAGGQGSGCFIDAARAMLEMVGDAGAGITAYLVMPSVYRAMSEFRDNPVAQRDLAANAYASLMELNALASASRGGCSPPPLHLPGLDVPRPGGFPFTEVHLVGADNQDGKHLEDPVDADAYDLIADALFTELDQNAFGTEKRSARCNVRPYLSDVIEYSINVDQDGIELEGGPLRYVNRFPTAYCAFGIARIPFDRARLQRAAAAWLSRSMLDLLIAERETPWNTAQINRIIAEQGRNLTLDPDGVVQGLLRDGTGRTFPEVAIDEVDDSFGDVLEAIDGALNIKGLSFEKAEVVLRDAPTACNRLQSQLQAALRAQMDTVDLRLRNDTPEPMWGDDFKSVSQARLSVVDRVVEDLERFCYALLRDPVNLGYGTLAAALERLESGFRESAKRSVDRPPRPQFEAPESVDLASVEEALGLLTEARQLMAPLYRRVAISHHERAAKARLEATAQRIQASLRTWAGRQRDAYERWVEGRYRQVAFEIASKAFEEIAKEIGKYDVVALPDGGTRIEATGLRQRFHRFRDRVATASNMFADLDEAYSNVRISARNGEDLAGRVDLKRETRRAVLGRRDMDEGDSFLLTAWADFFAVTGVVAADGEDVVSGGMQELVKRAVSADDDTTGWKSAVDRLEEWTVEQLRARGLLADQCVESLTDQGELVSRLKSLQSAAAAWCAFSGQNLEAELGVQPSRLFGTAKPHSDSIEQAMRQLGLVQPSEADSGSTLLFQQKSAFPLFAVGELSVCADAYSELLRDHPHLVPKRHTVRDPLTLPILLPAGNDEQAREWFESDRLVLEAVLLAVFKETTTAEDPDRQSLKFRYHDRSGGLHAQQLPRALQAISAHLRADPTLQRAVEDEVEKQRLVVFSPGVGAPPIANLAMHLAGWVQNTAFLRVQLAGEDDPQVLEHELARSLVARWTAMFEQGGCGSRDQAVEMVRHGSEAAPPTGVSASPVEAANCQVEHLLELVFPPGLL